MQAFSKSVISNQLGVHEDLDKIIQRMDFDSYQRPISSFSEEAFLEIIQWIRSHLESLPIILDLGCGVGESSYQLALKNPQALIIGIDKSLSRLKREWNFKKELPKNLFLIRGELLDLWYLFATDSRFPKHRVLKQWILYPNPWPKKKHVRRRWHANPVAPFIFSLNDEIEVRSNWKIYLEEFLVTAKTFGFYGVVEKYKAETFLTPFERKYSKSEQTIYSLIVNKKKAPN